MSRPMMFREDRAQFGNPRLLVVLAMLLAMIFFYLGHNPHISTVEGWTPWADTTSTFVSQNMALRGGIYALIAFLGFACVMISGASVPRLSLLAIPVLCFVGWSVMSLAWSHDAGTTLIRIGVMGLTCTAAYGFSRVLTPTQWIWLGVLVTGTYLVIGVMTEVALGTFRPWGAGYRFAGTVHPNEQGSLVAILVFGAYCQARWGQRDQKTWVLVLLVGLSFLLLTKSRTAFASSILVLALLECVVLPTRRSVFVGASLLWAVCGFVFLLAAFGIDLIDQFVEGVNLGRSSQSEGLNGRIPLWEAVVPFAREEMILGYGLDSFWTGDHIEHIQHLVHWPARDAHSLYLNMVLGVGVIGLSLFLLMILSAIARSAYEFRRTADPGYAFLIAMMLLMLAFGVLETIAALTSFFAVLICTGIARMAFEDPVPYRGMSHLESSVRASDRSRAFDPFAMKPGATRV